MFIEGVLSEREEEARRAHRERGVWASIRTHYAIYGAQCKMKM